MASEQQQRIQQEAVNKWNAAVIKVKSAHMVADNMAAVRERRCLKACWDEWMEEVEIGKEKRATFWRAHHHAKKLRMRTAFRALQESRDHAQ